MVEEELSVERKVHDDNVARRFSGGGVSIWKQSKSSRYEFFIAQDHGAVMGSYDDDLESRRRKHIIDKTLPDTESNPSHWRWQAMTDGSAKVAISRSTVPQAPGG